MWLLVAREPRANAPHWTGRRWLAVIDAVAWPLFWVFLLGQIDAPVGIVGPMVVAIALLVSAARIHRAVWVNHRYWFTTWRWGRIAASLFLIGPRWPPQTAPLLAGQTAPGRTVGWELYGRDGDA